MRAVIVLQARMGSSRLPGKVLEPIEGRPVVLHCLDRLVAAGDGPVVLATSDRPADDEVAAAADMVGVPVVRGDEEDVLARFVAVLHRYPADILVRATADNPAVDIEATRRTLRALLDAGADYCCEAGLPVGAAVEAVRADVLREVHQRGATPFDREHVTTAVKQDVARYRSVYPLAPHRIRRPDLRLTIDTPADLTWMRAVASALGRPLGPAPLASVIAAADRITLPGGPS